VAPFLLFAPSFVFGLTALAAAALALESRQGSNAEEVIGRNRIASLVAVVAAVLCALSLLVAAGFFLIDAFAETTVD
jgi:hypothetical protein